jgi:hypothetical protein
MVVLVITDACEIQSIQVTILSDIPCSTCTRLPKGMWGRHLGNYFPVRNKVQILSNKHRKPRPLICLSYKMGSKYFLGPSSRTQTAQNDIVLNSFGFGELRGRTRPLTLKL